MQENTKNYFDQPEVWNNTMLLYQEQVLSDILAILPQDVESILDVGCGNGLITNALPELIRVVGLDRSEEALRYVSRETVLGEILQLPFADESFDLVMANDVIEHLTSAQRTQALKELARVASKYVIITVPFLEDLNQSMTKCADCGRYYHVNHHLASFDLKETAELLTPFGYQCHRQILSGDTWESEPPSVVLAKRLLVFELAATDAPLCLYCNSKNVTIAKPVESMTDKLVSMLCLDNHDLIDWSSRRTECINLYAKDSFSTSKLPPGFKDIGGRQVVLDQEKLRSNQIDFQKPEIFKKGFIPLFSKLPYYLSDVVTTEGAILSENHRLLIGFFCCSNNPNQVIELNLSGRVETNGDMTIFIYDDKQGYISLIETKVYGNFFLKIPIPQACLSKYGILFEIRSQNCSITFTTSALTNVESDEIIIHDNHQKKARFWRLVGSDHVDLSLPLYDNYVVERKWMSNPDLLKKHNLPSLSDNDFYNLSSVLQKGYQTLNNEQQTLQVAYQVLQAAHQSLESKNLILQEAYQVLQAAHQSLESKNLTLQEAYQILQAAHQSLESKNLTLQEAYQILQAAHQTLEGEHQTLQETYQSLKGEYQILQTVHETLQIVHQTLQYVTPTLQSESKILQSEYKELQAVYNKTFVRRLKSTIIVIYQKFLTKIKLFRNKLDEQKNSILGK
ncbi:methyltransferase domain-containing protein [Nostoc sp. CHAB 5784]|uniref:class I SAM-dependent methyltransferase n=1 Tax=Nostoc mirabile TaxID=2907820 RepID=UPI001E2C0091|nr:methyltransferase domain-containing protein [Nostoc mirabile]MCC5664231.1 methyltransferase domain-containing protein [Nostoc mirabile CHAB5784]